MDDSIIWASWLRFTCLSGTRSFDVVVERWWINGIWLLDWWVVVSSFFALTGLFLRWPHFNSSIFVKMSASSSSTSFNLIPYLVLRNFTITAFWVNSLIFLFEAWRLLFLWFILDLLTNWHHSILNSVSHYIGLQLGQIVWDLRELLQWSHLDQRLNLINLLSRLGIKLLLFGLFT